MARLTREQLDAIRNNVHEEWNFTDLLDTIAALESDLAQAQEIARGVLRNPACPFRHPMSAWVIEQHEWTGCQQGGSPVEESSTEWVRYCNKCGLEDSCEDPLAACLEHCALCVEREQAVRKALEKIRGELNSDGDWEERESRIRALLPTAGGHVSKTDDNPVLGPSEATGGKGKYGF